MRQKEENRKKQECVIVTRICIVYAGIVILVSGHMARARDLDLILFLSFC